MSNDRPALPRLAVSALSWTVPHDWLDDVVRDLEEDYAEQAASRPVLAMLWLMSQVCCFVGRFLSASAADAFRSGAVAREGWALDLRGAVRSLKRRPWSNLTLIVTVAVAIGATTSVYTVVEGVLLRPLPYPEPEQLVRVWEVRKDWLQSPNLLYRSKAMSIDPGGPTFRRWAAEPTGFQELGAYVDTNFTLQTGGRVEAIHGQESTSGYFRALGLEPLMGRGLQPDDDIEGAALVVVLSESFWRDRLTDRQRQLGSTLTLNGEPHAIIGVMPSAFSTHPNQGLDSLMPPGGTQLWTPLKAEARAGWKSIQVVGRLHSESSIPNARDRLQAIQQTIAEGLSAEQAAQAGDRGVRLAGLLDSIVGNVRSTLWFLLAATALVLLVATVNIANILTARGLERRREIAVRAALGAGNSRLVRGQLVESLVVVTLGGAAGIATAWALLPLILQTLPPGVPRSSEIGMSLGVLVCGLAITGIAGILAGTLPALLATRANPQEAMRSSTRSTTAGIAASSLRSAMVATQVALAFVLLLGAVLLAGSYHQLWSEERGFEPSGIVALWIEPDWALYSTPEQYAQFVQRLSTELNEHPSIQASASNHLPLSGLSSGTRIELEQDDGNVLDVRALLTVSLHNYLNIMGIPLRRGRSFESADTVTSPFVALVNETMADVGWPGEDPLGKRLNVDGSGWIEVVGVVADAKHAGLEHPVDPKVYLPTTQSDRSINDWILRFDGDPGKGVETAKEILARVSPTSPVTREMHLESTIAESVAIPRFRTILVVWLASLAGMLALLGVYGMLTFAVAQRTREIGVRIALGARPSQVVSGVVAGGLKTALLGIAMGAPVAWLATDALVPFLFQVSPTDPRVFLAVIGALLLLSALASCLPARRASRVDPAVVLSDD